MAELIAEEGVLKDLAFALVDRDEWIIGRDPDLCNVVLEDPKISRQHFVIRRKKDAYYLENLNESNPISINGDEIFEETKLEEGDRITIGASAFRFYKERKVIEEERRVEEKETIFEAEEIHELSPTPRELQIPSRFLLKVIGGPNTGAEYVLDVGKEYLVGSDVTTCDIIFHDLSVSREHARLFLDADGKIHIEDLNSRNGVLIDKEKVEGKRELFPNEMVTLGTSIFLVIDREAPSMTIVSPLIGEEKEEEEIEEELVAAEPSPKRTFAFGPALLFSLIIAGLIILLGVGAVSLFKEEKVIAAAHDYQEEIKKALAPFPAVRFTYNANTGKLFLVGHVSTGVEKSALLHNLQGISCFKGIEDNVVVDEAVWQEMNLLLSKYPEFEGVSMHSPSPGKFLLTGYLKTFKQKSALTDFINVNFLYLSLLENKVVVEEEVLEEVASRLIQGGFNAVTVEFANGQLTLTGYVSQKKSDEFQKLSEALGDIHGVRAVRNFVVFISPEQAVVDLNEKFPGRYHVTGFSRCGNVNINVVINGRILMRGDTIDGMTISSLQPHTIFFEKDGLKYKLEYNK